MPSPTNRDPKRPNSDLSTRLASLSSAQKELLRERLAQRGKMVSDSPAGPSNDTNDDAIAIVGMGCRFPRANTLAEYWDLIEHGVDAVGPIPESRWSKDRFFDPTGRSTGKMSVDAMGAIDDVAGFDPGFFGIAPREAARMDPQQRLLLEITWETFENAGIPIDAMAGSNTGVFVGIGGTDYSKVPAHYPNYLDHVDAYSGTGNALSIAAGRISYLFDFQGPSFIVDTACSSALVAIHLAVSALTRGECDTAIAGGVNLILSPETTIAFSKARMLSPDGQCRPFDDAASGYVRGEGCGLVLLKRAGDAARDGDRILGIIRGSAVNQDGRTSGITAPNGESQQRVINAALADAGVTVDEIDYVEAHGTGTPLGDPIELMALDAVFARRNRDLPPVRVGSVKANIGHTETVSGIAGLLKVLQMFAHNSIPQQANFKSLNSNIRLHSGALRVADTTETWNGDAERIAGISSFGFGGTNAHLIVQAPSIPTQTPATEHTRPLPSTLFVPISAGDDAALQSLAGEMAECLSGVDDDGARDVGGTAIIHRAGLACRAAVIGDSAVELRNAFDTLADGKVSLTQIRGRRPTGRRTRLAMLFTGQGSQYAPMALRLAEALPRFNEALEECAEILDPILPIPLRQVLAGSANHPIDHTSLAQPTICAVQCALVDVLAELNIRPDVVAGHSIGEIAALYSVGAFDRSQSLLLATYRGRAMGALPPGGAMAAILASATDVNELIRQTGSSAVIATMNGETNNVIAGDADAVGAVIEAAESRSLVAQRLNVSHAFHSPLMEDAVEPLREKIETLFSSVAIPSSVEFISSVTGQPYEGEIDTRYWLKHLMQPVRFTDVMEHLSSADIDLAIEVGPTPQLTGMVRRARTTDGKSISVVPTLDRKQDDYRSFLRTVLSAWCVGTQVRWELLRDHLPSRRVDLPTYPFQRQPYWYDPPKPGSHGAGGELVHPLLGFRQSLADGTTIYSVVLRDTDPSFLADHVVSGSITVPAAAWIESIRAAAEEEFGDVYQVRDIEIHRALFLESGSRVSIQTSVHQNGSGACKIQIDAQAGGDDSEWQTCASAVAIKRVTQNVSVEPIDLSSEMDQRIDADDMYEAMAASGLEYGTFFRVLSDIKSNSRVASARLSLADELNAELHQNVLHPTLLDGALQLIASVIPTSDTNARTFLPVGVEKLTVHAGGPVCQARVQRLEPANDDKPFNEITADVQLLDESGNIVASLELVRLTSLTRDRGSDCENPSNWIHDVIWSFDDSPDSEDSDRAATSVELPHRHCGGRQLEQQIPQPFDAINGDREEWIWTAPEGTSSDTVGAATEDLLHTLQSAVRCETSPRVSVITERAFRVTGEEVIDPTATAIAAMVRVAAVEHPQLETRLLDVVDFGETSAELIARWLRRASDESELALRGEQFMRPRLVPSPRLFATNGDAGQLDLPEHGDYRVRLDGSNTTDGLWVERTVPSTPSAGEVSIDISAVGLNFSDVLKTMGLYPGLGDGVVPMGIEAAGVVRDVGTGVTNVRAGQRVMGIVPYGFSSADGTKDYLLTPIPDGISDEEAASIPVVFMTAHHALCNVGRLRKGENVLIHAGAGGVGIAAIQVAQAVGATVFTTAGSESKRKLLATLGVNPDNIFDSRDIESITAIRDRLVDGGMDVVLNSLPGEWIDASLGLLRAYGRFLEIGKVDIYRNKPLGLSPFQDNLSYSAIDLDRMFRERPDEVRELFAEVAKRFESGIYQPLPITSFRLAELPAAIRFMAARRNTGKIVVRPPQTARDTSAHRGLHLISGGSGAIAQGVARRLIQRGATAVVLVARRSRPDQVRELQKWAEQRGARCYYLQADCADKQQLSNAIDTIPAQDRQIVSVIHAAGLLDDCLIHEMTDDSLQRVLHPKVAGAISLDHVTAEHPVERFVLLGSIASVLGSPGQANYAAANGYLEGFAADRRSRGLPATVVHWGPWASGGMADDPARLRNLAARGLHPLDFDRAIDLLIDTSEGTAKSGSLPVVLDADFGQMLRSTNQTSSLLRGVHADSIEHASVAGGAVRDTMILDELSKLDAAGRQLRLCAYFADQLGKIMTMSPESFDVAQPLAALGLDSLMAIELKNTIEARLDITIPINKFMDDPTLESLAETATTLIQFDETEQVIASS